MICDAKPKVFLQGIYEEGLRVDTLDKVIKLVCLVVSFVTKVITLNKVWKNKGLFLMKLKRNHIVEKHYLLIKP